MVVPAVLVAALPLRGCLGTRLVAQGLPLGSLSSEATVPLSPSSSRSSSSDCVSFIRARLSSSISSASLSLWLSFERVREKGCGLAGCDSLLGGLAWILSGLFVVALSVAGLLLRPLLWRPFLEPSRVSDSVVDRPLLTGRSLLLSLVATLDSLTLAEVCEIWDGVASAVLLRLGRGAFASPAWVSGPPREAVIRCRVLLCGCERLSGGGSLSARDAPCGGNI
jgi:hypothetical protein